MTADSGTVSTTPDGAGASRARYLAGLVFSEDSHPAQQIQTFRPSTSTVSGSPIDPSLAFVTGHFSCSAALRLTPVCPFDAATRDRKSGVSDTGVLRLTEANIPGRSRNPGFARS